MFFYELHEGDEEIFSDVLLVHETEFDPDEFFEIVQTARRQVQDNYDDDTLIEAIARELEREHGFVFIADGRLTAAVNVSVVEKDNFLAVVADEVEDAHEPEAGEDDDGDDDDEELEGDFRTILADFDPSALDPGAR